jgi:hypothetical protein
LKDLREGLGIIDQELEEYEADTTLNWHFNYGAIEVCLGSHDQRHNFMISSKP